MQKSAVRELLVEQRDGIAEFGEYEMYSRTDILNAACSLFYEHGYRGTTVREIARMLDLKEGSLYTHIKSKEELLWEIVDRLADLFLSQASFVARDLPCAEQLALLVRGHLDVITHETQGATVFFREWHMLSPDLRERIQEKRARYEAHFYRVLAEGKEQHVFCFSDTRLAALFLLSSLNGAYEWFVWTEPSQLAQVEEQYAQFLLSALKGK